MPKAFDGWGIARWGREEFHGLVTWIGLGAQFHTFSSFPLFFIRWKEQAFEEGAEIAKQAQGFCRCVTFCRSKSLDITDLPGDKAESKTCGIADGQSLLALWQQNFDSLQPKDLPEKKR